MFIEQSHDEVYGCLRGGSGNSGGKRLAISMVEEAWLSEKKEVFSTWMAFGGNTRDLGSFGEETDEITDLHQIHEEILLQSVETVSQA
ncbi:hypothetical protein Tco_0607900 [Tanacetum coccineum]